MKFGYSTPAPGDKAWEVNLDGVLLQGFAPDCIEALRLARLESGISDVRHPQVSEVTAGAWVDATVVNAPEKAAPEKAAPEETSPEGQPEGLQDAPETPAAEEAPQTPAEPEGEPQSQPEPLILPGEPLPDPFAEQPAEQPTEADLIRAELAASPGIENKAIVAKLKAQGITVTSSQLSAIKKELAKQG